jgi:hypothetical protein
MDSGLCTAYNITKNISQSVMTKCCYVHKLDVNVLAQQRSNSQCTNFPAFHSRNNKRAIGD